MTPKSSQTQLRFDYNANSSSSFKLTLQQSRTICLMIAGMLNIQLESYFGSLFAQLKQFQTQTMVFCGQNEYTRKLAFKCF
jgi:hypothetical protein